MAPKATAIGGRVAAPFCVATLIIAAIAAYFNGLRGPFVFDDVEAIVENPTIRHLWPLAEALSPPAGGSSVSGRPLLNFSLALNYALSGEATWSYHALNLAVHICAGLALFGIVRLTLVGVGVKGCGSAANGLPRDFKLTDRGPDPTLVAWASALLWTLHPLQTESVTYVIQRAESMAGMFYLLTLYCFARGTRSGRFFIWGSLSIVGCFLGVATKETLVTAPLIVLLYDRAYVAGSLRQAWRERRGYYAGLAGSWLLLGFLMVHNGGNRGGTVGFNVGVAWWAYPLTQFKALALYLRLAVWPHPLVFEYGTFWVKSAAEVLPYAIPVMTVFAFTVVAFGRWPRMGFLGAWFFIILAPTSLVPGVSQMIVEHRMYLPLAGAVVLAALGTWELVRACCGLSWVAANGTATGFVLAVALVFGWLTDLRNRDYRTALTLWSDTVAKRPANAWAHCNLGVAWFDAGRIDEAIREYEAALRLNPANLQPNNAHVRYNLANAQVRRGLVPEAIANYQAALRLAPNDARAHCNYGSALVLNRQLDQGISEIETSIRLNKLSSEAHNDLGFALVRAGRVDDALNEYKTALRLRPEDASISYNLGSALAGAGRLDEAIARYRDALVKKPDYPEAHNNLANALAQTGHPEESLQEYAEALRLRREYVEARFNRAVTLVGLSRTSEARQDLLEALRQKPDFAPARQLLGSIPER